MNGRDHERLYDRFPQRRDDTRVGVEVKHGTIRYPEEQRTFDALVSPNNPARATLDDGRVIEIIDVHIERVPRQQFPKTP